MGHLQPLEEIGTRVRFTPGTTLFSEGEAATRTFRVLCGAVRLCKHTNNGRRQIVDFALEGDMFGLMPVAEYPVTAEAVNEVVVMSYPRAQLERMARQSPALQADVLGLISRQLLGMHGHLVMVGRQTARERLAAFLVKLAERADVVEGTVELPMPRQDIADYLGLTIETVCREISALKRAKIISAPDLHAVDIRDFDALAAIAAAEE